MPSRVPSGSRVGRIVVLVLVIALAAILFAKFDALPVAAQSPTPLYRFDNVVIGGGGGFIPGIVFSARQPGLVYARTDIGGAYRFDPDSGSWVPLLDWVGFDNWNLSGVESIAIDPVDPQRVYLAVGTYTNEWASQNGAILRSPNQGRTFQRFDLPFKVGGNMPGRGMGERLAIDPNNNAVLYLGTRSGNGLWRSTDYGETWSKVANFPDSGPYFQDASSSYTSDPVGVVWVTFDPRTTVGVGRMQVSKNIYVGVADTVNPSVYRSTDGGQTWAAIPGEPLGFMAHHGKLASNGVMYFSFNNNAGPYDGTAGDVWKFDTGTGIWTKITPPAAFGTPYGFGGLAVDAQHPNTIVVATVNDWWPDTDFFRSLDGGSTWSAIWSPNWGQPWPNIIGPLYTIDYASVAPWLTFGGTPATCTSSASTSGSCPTPTPKLGWMVESLEIDPFNSDRMLYGTGATMYGTDNLTAWDSGGTVNIGVKGVGIEETAVQDLISPPAGPAHLISAIADNGGYTHNDLTQPSVMDANPVFTTGTSLDYAELNPTFVVRVGSGGTNGKNIGFSTDGGQTWFPGSAQPSGASGGTVAAAANGSRVLWSSGPGVLFSTDNGTTWTASTNIPIGASVRSDRVNPLKFYGFAGGTFYVSIDGGATFAPSAASSLPSSGQFKAAPGHEGDIWLVGSTGVWHSTNSGASFTMLSNVQAGNTIGFGMPAPKHNYPAIYSSAEVNGTWGIYRSIDGGATWTRVNDDRHQYALTNNAITGDPRVFGRVYISTNGRGIIYGDPVAIPQSAP